MSAAEQALQDGLDRIFTGITELVRQLRVITLQPDFETTYRVPKYGRAPEIRRLLTWFDGISRTKREQIRRLHIQVRDHTPRVNSHRLIETLNRMSSDHMNRLDKRLSDCLYFDRDLFDESTDNPQPKPRPQAWETFIETVRALQQTEEEFFQLTKSHPKEWSAIRFREEDEDWKQYDFVKDPKLLSNMNSLLAQLHELC
jgi:hypothetical protein